VKIWKKKTIKVVDDVRCDSCGKSTTNCYSPDYATLEGCWGYGSKNDGTKYHVDLCENCFFDVLDFIKKKRKEVLGPFNYPYDNDPLEGTEYL